jgi:hypothetical protein
MVILIIMAVVVAVDPMSSIQTTAPLWWLEEAGEVL